MDRDAGGTSIQDQYLTRARKERSWLTVVLNSGKKIAGRIVSFDRYTVILEDRGQEEMVFKHAIATISMSRSFSNTIKLDRAGAGKDRSGRGPEAAGKPQAAGEAQTPRGPQGESGGPAAGGDAPSRPTDGE